MLVEGRWMGLGSLQEPVVARGVLIARRSALHGGIMGVVVLCAVTVLNAVLSGSSCGGVYSCVESYVFHESRGAATVTSSESAEVEALAIDRGVGGGSSHLWVSEHNAGVYEFGAVTGAKLAEVSPLLPGNANGVAVGHGAGEAQVYVTYSFTPTPEVGVYGGSCPGGKCSLFEHGRWNGSDTKAKTFGSRIGGVAVDNNSNALEDPGAGRVYVADGGEDVIDVFKPKPNGEEEFVGAIEGAEPSKPFIAPFNHWDVVVDQANGDVLVENTLGEGQPHVVDIFEPEVGVGYRFKGEIAGSPLSGVFGGGQLALDVGPDAEGVDQGGVVESAYVAEETAKVVDEFLWPGGMFVGRITGVEPGMESAGGVFGVKARLSSVAVDPLTRDVFVGVDPAAGRFPFVERFAEGVVLPSVTDGVVLPVSIEGGLVTEKLSGTVNPLEKETNEGAKCQFVWGTSAEDLSNVAKCPGTLSGNSPVLAQATIGGLRPDTTYSYRLTASNAKGTNPGVEEEDGNLEPVHEFTTPGPGLHGVSVSRVTSSSATLEAMFDPHGASSSYQLEYGTGDCSVSPSSCKMVPVGPEGVGAGEEDVEVSQHVQGLEPETVYHYRVVVVSDLKVPSTEPAREFSFVGPERTFVTQRGSGGAGGLIDGRAWELVSPAAKNGALIVGLNQETATIQASVEGGAISYVTRSPTEVGGVQGYSRRNQVLSVRGGDGWRSCDLGTVQATPEGPTNDFPEFPLFSQDLSSAIVQQEAFNSTLLSEEASERTPYVAGLEGCEGKPAFVPVATGKEPFKDVTSNKHFGGGPGEPAVRFVAASPDLDHVVVDSAVQLTTTPTIPGEQELYEWSADKSPAERLQLVSKLPGPSGGVAPGVDVGSGDGRNAVSDDGTRVFWHGYMRDMVAGGGTGETIPVGGVFQFATGEITGPARVSKAFFTEGNQLYECEMVEEASKVKCNRTDLTPPGAEVVGNVSVSKDGSYVYFVANGVLGNGLEGGAKPGGCTLTTVIVLDTTCNLYVYHDGVTHFIATLAAEDEMDWGLTNGNLGNKLASLWSSVSPDGRFFTFMSNRSLTGYDNRDVSSGRLDEEVFLYDAVSGRLVCASCDPTGSRPVGVENNGEGGRLVFSTSELAGYSGRWYAASLPGWPEVGGFGLAFHQARYLSDGGRLFFNADGGLVPGDVNGTEDVYEYEPEGASCSAAIGGPDVVFERERSYEVEGRVGVEGGGCVGLISSGRSPDESAFLDASEGGGEAFFLTSEQLVSQDRDGSPDVYVARECPASSPCLFSPSEPSLPCGTADSCRSAPTPQPGVFGAPSSATFSGPEEGMTTTVPSLPSKSSLTGVQKLALALRACHRDRSRHKRLLCERMARRRYGRAKSFSVGGRKWGGR